ncbi:Uncharacterised protein [BD1-7 clade bacterium]|uniref:Uncharacterized protein n=1 Tax=BD1-7 clade bacterium TaxID=2029982 RepID=A0A5S9PCR4_9GAMM|nr:Uncharacterised protein [BD1-7 clade bacterium]
MKLKLPIQLVSLFLTAILMAGCSSFVEQQADKFANSVSETMLNFEDPETVGSAMPTFLILIDSFARKPDAGGKAQLSAAQIYGAYAGAFVEDPRRKKILSDKAFNYAQKGSCQMNKKWCGIDSLDAAAFQEFADELHKDDVPLAYAYSIAWLSFIQSHSDDWNVLADLSKAQRLLGIVVEFDEGYEHGTAHLYLAAIATTLPPALGGKPDVGKHHFERAIELSNGRNFLAKVEYARRYARLTFDQDLHHQLLEDVLAADPHEPGLTLMNAWSQQQAALLLEGESEYFE